MLCSFKKLIYPKNAEEVQNGSYAIALYKLHEKLLDLQQNPITEVKVVGHYLPLVEGLKIDMTGTWEKNPTHGMQFMMESYKEIISPTRQGIISYLSSGLIKGIGPKTAEKIYDAFGSETLEVLDRTPEELLKIRGISETKLQAICESYVISRGARDIITLLTPYGVTPNRAVKIYQHFGPEAAEIARKTPYRLCEMTGIGFLIADRIAVNMGLDMGSSERIEAGLFYVLQEAESRGNMCMEKHSFVKRGVELLGAQYVNIKSVANVAYKLLQEGGLVLYGDKVFRYQTAKAEEALSTYIAKFLSYGSVPYQGDIDADITLLASANNVKPDLEQRQAIKTCLTSYLSLLTGGPGTGKTLLQRFILELYKKQHPGAKIVCCAPTGRASRLMTRSTGHPASTIHKALGLLAGEDGNYNQPEPLDADLVLIDEVSMLDTYLAKNLFSALPPRCQVILIGDAHQLPSVGPGAVLSELLSCNLIPTAMLDRVYRQASGGYIAINAQKIRHGNVGLDYAPENFSMIESSNLEKSAAIIEELYLREVETFGIDSVALLTPFRYKTATGVDSLNERLREKINPHEKGKPEVISGKKVYRQGDKVMWTKNKDDINNGDIGYISKIVSYQDESIITVDFGDGRIVDLKVSELEYLDGAYATTVHKSQGSEYESIILNLQMCHYNMLVRPLIYTAITRAKKHVCIVGSRKAVCIAIKTEDTEKRGTMLAQRIIERVKTYQKGA